MSTWWCWKRGYKPSCFMHYGPSCATWPDGPAARTGLLAPKREVQRTVVVPSDSSSPLCCSRVSRLRCQLLFCSAWGIVEVPRSRPLLRRWTRTLENFCDPCWSGPAVSPAHTKQVAAVHPRIRKNCFYLLSMAKQGLSQWEKTFHMYHHLSLAKILISQR